MSVLMSDELFRWVVVLNISSIGMLVGMYAERIIAAIQGRKDGARPSPWSLLVGMPVVATFFSSLIAIVIYRW